MHTSPKQRKRNKAANNSSVQEVLDIVHSQQSPRGNPTRSNSLKMGRLGQTVPLPAIANTGLPPRPSTSFGDRASTKENLLTNSSQEVVSRSFPPPISSLNLGSNDSTGGRKITHVGKINDTSSSNRDLGNYLNQTEKPTRPHTSYGRRRRDPAVHGTSESNQIVIPTCPVTNEFRSSSSQDGETRFDDRDAEIMKICKSSRRGSKKKEKEKCVSPVKGLLIRKSSVE